MFQHVDEYGGDPILSLMDDFNRDPRAEKVNLSIGFYYDEKGQVPQLSAINSAVKQIAHYGEQATLYLPMEGLVEYRQGVQTLLFGDHVPPQRIATIQTLGGSGALKVGADFLAQVYSDSEVFISEPSWENHRAIFSGAGLKVQRYPWYDASTQAVAFTQLLEKLHTLTPKSIVLLHPCCHNPTGADLTNQQWDQVIKVLAQRQLIPFMDMAYQGLASGLEEDAYAIRAAARSGLSVLVSNSFSKIFSLYGERVGGLSVLCGTETQAQCVLGQLKAAIRRNYSNPPSYGARLVSTVMNNSELFECWRAELETMRLRILSMRQALVDALQQTQLTRSFAFLLTQRGLFSYTGLTPKQVQRLRDEFAIYLLNSGRMCMAGLNQDNVQRVALAIAAVSAF